MLIGDVLLVTGQSKLSVGLVAAQKAIYKEAKSSHVEFGLGDGFFIHATNDGGVHLSFLLDELENCNSDWRVIRLTNLKEGEREQLVKSALYFLRQGYNKVYMGEGTEHSSFCSELVAKAYKKAGLPVIDGKMPSKVAPAHFDKEADALIEWANVTNEYRDRLAEMEKDRPLYRMVLNHLQGSFAMRHMASQARGSIFQVMEMLSEHDENSKLREVFQDVKQQLREKRELHFWDENDES